MENFLNFLKNSDCMIFYKSKDFKVGLKVEINNEPCVILENEFVNPGKGQAFNRLKLKSFISGLVIRKTVKLGEKLKDVDLFELKVRYLYVENNIFYFFHEESLEYYEINIDIIGKKSNWIKEGCQCFIMFWNNNIISFKPEKFLELTVISSEEVNSNTVITRSFKQAVLETGVSIKVPLFVKKDDVIKVDTEDEVYISRVN